MKVNFWEGKRVLITGGAGFIGSNLAEKLVGLGVEAVIIDNLERGKKEYLEPFLKFIDFHIVDLRERFACIKYLKNVDVVFHLAAKVGGIKYYLEKPYEVLSQNIMIDSFVLESALKAKVNYFFYASSAHVYPLKLQLKPNSPPIKEEQAYPANPELSYGWAKLITERQIESLINKDMDCHFSIFRIIGAYGKNQDIDYETGSVIPVFTRRAVEYSDKKPFIILGTGKETRSYCFIDDIIAAILISIQKLNKTKFIGPLNVGSGERISIQSLAKKIIDISRKDIEIEYVDNWQTKIWGQVLDCSRAYNQLNGWKPKISLDEGLKRVFISIKDHLKNKNL